MDRRTDAEVLNSRRVLKGESHTYVARCSPLSSSRGEGAGWDGMGWSGIVVSGLFLSCFAATMTILLLSSPSRSRSRSPCRASRHMFERACFLFLSRPRRSEGCVEQKLPSGSLFLVGCFQLPCHITHSAYGGTATQGPSLAQ